MSNFHYKKSLGQNFLKDELVLDKIIEESQIDENTLVIEIGPGAGALSYKILKKAKMAILYEVDTRLEKILYKNLDEFSNFKLIMKDFLNADVMSDIKDYQYKKIYLIANLPYYITTPIITKIMKEKLPISKLVVMVQKEVADRFTALPNTKSYGSFTVLLNYYYNVRKLFDVDKSSFEPVPKVDSSVIELIKKEDAVVKDVDFFINFVRDCFQYKRKNLKNNLYKYDLKKIDKILSKYGLNIYARAESLTLEIFIILANELC